MTEINTSFTSATVGEYIYIRPGESFDYTVSGTFSGTWQIEKEVGYGVAQPVVSGSSTAAGNFQDAANTSGARYRFRCNTYVSGTMVTNIRDANDAYKTIQSPDGTILERVTEQGIEAPNIKFKMVKVASTANGTLATAFAAGQTVDGVTLVAGDRILLKDQSTGAENGVYIVQATGAPIRAFDGDAGAEILGSAFYVLQGTVNAATQWVVTNTTEPTLGSTALTFAQIGGPRSLTRLFTAGAKAGATAGWVVAAATDIHRCATLPASHTNSTLVVPISGLQVGDIITNMFLMGQIESGGNTVTLDWALHKTTTATADIVDSSVQAGSQVTATADRTLTSTNCTVALGTPDTVAAGEVFYALLTGTTAAATDIDFQGVGITFTRPSGG